MGYCFKSRAPGGGGENEMLLERGGMHARGQCCGGQGIHGSGINVPHLPPGQSCLSSRGEATYSSSCFFVGVAIGLMACCL